MFKTLETIELMSNSDTNEVYFKRLSDNKLISLPSFHKALSGLINKEDYVDTGFMPKNLVKVLTSNVSEVYVYHVDELTFNCSVEGDHTLISNTEKFPLTYQNNYTFLPEFKVQDIVLIVKYNKQEHSVKYYITFLDSSDSLFTELDDNSVLRLNLFPNHFSNGICWGESEMNNILILDYCRNKNYKGIYSIISAYFNSTFNVDLCKSQSLVDFIQSNNEEYKEYLFKYYSSEEVEKLLNFNNYGVFYYLFNLRVIFSNPTLKNKLLKQYSSVVLKELI